MTLENLVKQATSEEFNIPLEEIPRFDVQFTPDPALGDYAVPIGFALAKQLRMAPDEVTKRLAAKLNGPFAVDAVKGYLNFTMSDQWWLDALNRGFVRYPRLKGRVLIEFVSANPTGPVHIGHGRGAVVGSVLTSLFKKVFDTANSEFYVNDAGEQIRRFCQSVELRIRQLMGENLELPEDYYQGEYIIDIARWIVERYSWYELSDEERWRVLWNDAVSLMIEWHQASLHKIGVHIENWVSERDIRKQGWPERVVHLLKAKGLAYESDGAVWFKSTEFGDDKDRVLVKSNGEFTYYLVDVAYHLEKLENRGYDMVVNVWGADHIGHVARMDAALSALGHPEKLRVVLVQTVRFWREGKPVAMSKRKGEFLTLDELVEEIGKDAARLTFLTRSVDSTLDFDIEVAKKQAMENPVYYIQYAYVRAKNILSKENERTFGHSVQFGVEERALLRLLESFEERMKLAVRKMDPFLIQSYAWEMADAFHKFYQSQRVIGSEFENVRWLLVERFLETLGELLDLLGIEKLERM
ncbi:arginine--tRNA ligase [Coprothermobacteraceae bacterium]|nr:arginine--tRNA ligase [Coprothermobacteraceae bacterium]